MYFNEKPYYIIVDIASSKSSLHNNFARVSDSIEHGKVSSYKIGLNGFIYRDLL